MRTLTSPPSRPSRLAAAALAGALALGLAACSVGSNDSGGDASVVGEAPADLGDDSFGAPDATGGRASEESARSGGGVSGSTGAASSTVVLSALDRKLARRADVSLRVDDVTAAAARLRAIAVAAGGLVVAEQISTDVDSGAREATTVERPLPAGYGSVTISVPTDKLDSTLDTLDDVGVVLSRQTSTDDVTGQYVDTESRVKSMEASVERVRALMTRATKLADIVTLEAELSRRQMDLEAMQQQLAALEDRVALAPISVSLSTTGDVPPEDDPTGFIAGLAAGWEAFTTSVTLVLTLVGAVIPFALFGILVAAPLVLWWRRRTRTAPVGAPPAAPTV